MKNRINKKVVTAAILSVLIMVLLCASAFAASYSKVYGRTKERVRVRASASTSATVIDNIIKDACVYVSTSSTSGASTFVKVTYRNSDGNIATGWICQHDGDETLVTILSDAQAQNWYGVKSGNLPSKKVGTFTASQRAAAAKEATANPVSSSTTFTTAYVREIQTMLKELGYYYGEITGNIGNKTENAVEAFQKANNLSADGIPGPNTYARLQSVYTSKGGSSSSSSSGSGLRLGSSGTNVRNMQQDLTTLGFYWAEVTGNFGEKTETAVKRFQEEYGLTADGVAGTKTLEAINDALKKGGYSSSTTVPTGTSLSLNMKSDAVLALQEALAALGYYGGELTGNFGPKTEAAVEDFQRAKGLTADGVAGPKTLEAINSARKSSGGSLSETLRLDSTGETVRALQRDLAALGYYTGEVTGHFGDKTKTAVSKFQKAKGLTNDGVAGPATLNAIVAALGSSSSLSSGSASVSGSLRHGDNNDSVKDLQTRLEKLGYYYGELTGKFGDLTERAVRKFQDDNDLTVDGIAGADTLKLLYSKTGGTYNGSSSTSSGTMYGTLNTDNVSLRESYSTSAKAVVELDSGKALKITKTVTVNGETWYYCTAEKGNYTYKGYVNSTYVTIGSYNDFVAGGGDDISLGVEVLGMIRVTGDKVSIRADHDADSDRLGYAYKDDVYYYINTRSYDGGWFQISSGGWIQQKYATRLTESEMDAYGGNSNGKTSYRLGDSGSMVTWIQEALDELDYYDGKITGTYGSLTHDAVQAFQRDHDLSGDGIAGQKTIAAIQNALSGKVTSSGSIGSVNSDNIVYNLDWFTYLNNGILTGFGIKKNEKVTLTDLQTGKTFDAKIQSMGNHIDAEPWDSRDTKVLASIYGKSSGSDLKGIYKRRPMVLTTKYGFSVIVSIYPEPHGDDTIANNEYDGQFCLHMSGSKTHGTDRVDDDPNGHQEMIKKGVSYLTDPNGSYKKAVSTAYPATTASTTGTISGTSNVIPTPTPTVQTVIHDDTVVYTKAGWTYAHPDKNCKNLKNDQGEKTTYKAANKKICPDCNPTWIYFGDTSKTSYHTKADCTHLASFNYAKIYQSTKDGAFAGRTHDCSKCK